MNLYDTKSITCSKCNKFIGEIEHDAVVTLPKCGQCANPFPEGDDKLAYAKTRIINGARNELYTRIATT
ncbi:MAG: hypothetical protein E6K87_04015 [Thaumarchaeota archaeon]|nr:MAG: hypothetical protein E6K87_04015 [Nitrososphaerota archaeon]